MTPTTSNTRSIIAINFSLLYAVVLAGISWLSWPETAEGWRMGMISIGCGLGALGLVVRALMDIWRFVKSDITVHSFNKVDGEPKSDKLADTDALRKARMLK